uniref:Uncharacterized protein n=1 Tax=Oryza brachyantha TaxID=4533 RepID=J3KUF2_ORYBR
MAMTRLGRLTNCFQGTSSRAESLGYFSLDRHLYLSYPLSWPVPELKRVAEVSADEPAAKRIVFNPDTELSEAIKDADAPCPQRSPSPPPLSRLRKPAFKQGSSCPGAGNCFKAGCHYSPNRHQGSCWPTRLIAYSVPASAAAPATPAIGASADSMITELTATPVIGAASRTPSTPPPLPVGPEVTEAMFVVTATTEERALIPTASIEHAARPPLSDEEVGGSLERRKERMVITASLMATVMFRASARYVPLQLITWVKEGRTDGTGIRLDASEGQCDIARLEDFISWSVQIMKALKADQATAMEETKKAHTGLQAECSKLLASKANLEVECSKLKASNALLESECSKLNKSKDTPTTELIAEAQTRARAIVEAAEAKTKAAELARDRLVAAVQVILGSIESLALGSSLANVDDVVRRLKEVPAQHGAELRETTKMGVSHALAVIKSLYPWVDLSVVIDGFAANRDVEAALKLTNDAQPTAESVVDSIGQ